MIPDFWEKIFTCVLLPMNPMRFVETRVMSDLLIDMLYEYLLLLKSSNVSVVLPVILYF